MKDKTNTYNQCTASRKRVKFTSSVALTLTDGDIRGPSKGNSKQSRRYQMLVPSPQQFTHTHGNCTRTNCRRLCLVVLFCLVYRIYTPILLADVCVFCVCLGLSLCPCLSLAWEWVGLVGWPGITTLTPPYPYPKPTDGIVPAKHKFQFVLFHHIGSQRAHHQLFPLV
jgi:hypothetical protein